MTKEIDRICIDCKWVTEGKKTQRTSNGKKQWAVYYCKHKKVSRHQGKKDLVTGEALPDILKLCADARAEVDPPGHVWQNGYIEVCGSMGLHWEARDDENDGIGKGGIGSGAGGVGIASGMSATVLKSEEAKNE